MAEIIKAHTPNSSVRTENVRFLVLHHTELPDIKSVYNIFENTTPPVSSHYLVGRDGSLHQFVADDVCAHHAGISYWDGVTNLNQTSIGIELDNDGNEPFTPDLMQTTIELCNLLMATHAIKPQDVVAHSDIAYWRKVDPSVYLDWAALAEYGIGLVSTAQTNDEILFTHQHIHSDIIITKHKLGMLGYKISDIDNNEFCDKTLALFQAFKRRFVKESYPHNNWDATCSARLEDLLRIYGKK
ncbi:MAG: N-acetylmuramoyl-L-alanine amidase [Rickettsiales bacterium]